MRAGCIPVTVNKTGIGEIVENFGVTIPGEITEDAWQQHAIEVCVNLILQEDKRKLMEERVINRGKMVSWEKRKDLWLKILKN